MSLLPLQEASGGAIVPECRGGRGASSVFLLRDLSCLAAASQRVAGGL